MRKRILACAFAVALVSCASGPKGALPKDETTPVFGMIYDTDNSPVAEADISVDGISVTRSDVNGRFALPSLSLGRYNVTAQKEDYESVGFDFEYSNPTQIIYMKMISVDQLISLVEDDLDHREWEKAIRLLDRVEAIRKDDPAALYLRAVIYFQKGAYDDSRSLLESFLAKGFHEPSVYIFLADILEKKLKDPKGAIRYLQAYLEQRFDPDLEARLKELKKQEN
jgi:tetratricopeptide (TPR) repeat protein